MSLSCAQCFSNGTSMFAREEVIEHVPRGNVARLTTSSPSACARLHAAEWRAQLTRHAASSHLSPLRLDTASALVAVGGNVVSEGGEHVVTVGIAPAGGTGGGNVRIVGTGGTTVAVGAGGGDTVGGLGTKVASGTTGAAAEFLVLQSLACGPAGPLQCVQQVEYVLKAFLPQSFAQSLASADGGAVGAVCDRVARATADSATHPANVL